MKHSTPGIGATFTVLGLLILIVAACQASLPASGARSGSGLIALPTEQPQALPPGASLMCAGIGISAVIRGDPADPHVTWLIAQPGARLETLWLPGYHARFNPTLEVLDATGAVVLREGDRVNGGCETSGQDVLLLAPPF